LPCIFGQAASCGSMMRSRKSSKRSRRVWLYTTVNTERPSCRFSQPASSSALPKACNTVDSRNPHACGTPFLNASAYKKKERYCPNPFEKYGSAEECATKPQNLPRKTVLTLPFFLYFLWVIKKYISIVLFLFSFWIDFDILLPISARRVTE
jgi:hypothetical protein